MEMYLKDSAIRKAIAVYYIGNILEEHYKGKREDFAKTVFGKSGPTLSRWTSLQADERTTCPTIEQIKQLANQTGYSVYYILQETLSQEDKYGILRDSITAKEFRKKYSIGEERTHDSSPAHIRNLRTFSGHKYELFYLDIDPETNKKEIDSFITERINEPKESGYLEMRMSRDKEEEVYIGTILAPPNLNKAFIYLSQRNADAIYLDRGMAVLYFPQERARNSGEGFKCGVGVAITLDRHNPQNVLFQRIVVKQESLETDNSFREFLEEYLSKPIVGDNVLAVTDLWESQHALFGHIKSRSAVPEHDTLFGT